MQITNNGMLFFSSPPLNLSIFKTKLYFKYEQYQKANQEKKSRLYFSSFLTQKYCQKHK